MTAEEDRIPPPEAEVARFHDDLRMSVATGLAGIGMAPRGKRPSYALQTTVAHQVAPLVIEHMMRSGWRFRHWSWPEAMFIGRKHIPLPASPMAGHMPLLDES